MRERVYGRVRGGGRLRGRDSQFTLLHHGGITVRCG